MHAAANLPGIPATAQLTPVVADYLQECRDTLKALSHAHLRVGVATVLDRTTAMARDGDFGKTQRAFDVLIRHPTSRHRQCSVDDLLLAAHADGWPVGAAFCTSTEGGIRFDEALESVLFFNSEPFGIRQLFYAVARDGVRRHFLNGRFRASGAAGESAAGAAAPRTPQPTRRPIAALLASLTRQASAESSLWPSSPASAAPSRQTSSAPSDGASGPSAASQAGLCCVKTLVYYDSPLLACCHDREYLFDCRYSRGGEVAGKTAFESAVEESHDRRVPRRGAPAAMAQTAAHQGAPRRGAQPPAPPPAPVPAQRPSSDPQMPEASRAPAGMDRHASTPELRPRLQSLRRGPRLFSVSRRSTSRQAADLKQCEDRCRRNRLLTVFARLREQNIFSVALVVEGGPVTGDVCMSAFQRRVPVVVVDGSGRFADLLSFAWRLLHEPGAGSGLSLPGLKEKVVRLLQVSPPHVSFVPTP